MVAGHWLLVKQPLNHLVLSVLTNFPLQATHSATRTGIVQYTHDNTLNHFSVSREMMSPTLDYNSGIEKGVSGVSRTPRENYS